MNFPADAGADIHVIVKIESADSIPNLHSIITASDGVRTLLFVLLNQKKDFFFFLSMTNFQ